jgi:tetratricopeptide (TPR) repeat protein
MCLWRTGPRKRTDRSAFVVINLNSSGFGENMTAEKSGTLPDRYNEFLTNLVDNILGGKQIISREFIHRLLGEQVMPGTSEVLEGCIQAQQQSISTQITETPSEIKQAKLGHRFKALQTIGEVLTKWQKERQEIEIVTQIVNELITAEPDERLTILFRAIDRNQSKPLQSEQLRKIVTGLRQSNLDIIEPEQINQLATGLENGLANLTTLEAHLVSWIYEGRQVGFETAQANSPWSLWAKHINNSVTQKLFMTLGEQQSVAEFASQQSASYADDWVQIAIILQGLQIGLVRWFDRQMYDIKWGERAAFSTLITFGIIWCELANGVGTTTNQRKSLSQACWQITWQSLRITAQRNDFPLYGGIFATFSGETWQDALAYFDQPLKQVEGTQEKGRILTMLGYSQHALGMVDRSISLHQEALDIANIAGDQACAVANLNHLSRIYLREKDYAAASSHSQRALISARQTGDRRGEANALINYGYSEILAAQQREEMEAEVYEQNIDYLKQGLKIAQKLEDRQSLALCYHSLGIAYFVLKEMDEAISYLSQGISAAQTTNDLYLRGLGITYLAEVYYSRQDYTLSIFYAGVGMYALHQIGAREWRQAAGILSILTGQLGAAGLVLAQEKLVTSIGVAGYESLAELLAEYRRSA